MKNNQQSITQIITSDLDINSVKEVIDIYVNGH